MSGLGTQLLELYLRLGAGVLVGVAIGRYLPKIVPAYLGKFLFWIGVPISIVAFLRQADLSGAIWIAPVIAWVAILFGAGLAWFWIQFQQGDTSIWNKPTQGSFLLIAMVGNTGYLGYPITLTLVGTTYFGWALFYDLLGTTVAAYGLGVVMAARFGMGVQHHWELLQAVLKNPALFSLLLGLSLRQVPLPPLVEQGLQLSGWATVTLSLALIGMRLSYLSSWGKLKQACVSLGIKMLVVPLVLGVGLSFLGLTGSPQLVIVLQMAMPPAFATLVLAEAYNLDRDLTVTALAGGFIILLLTLPIWVLLFSG